MFFKLFSKSKADVNKSDSIKLTSPKNNKGNEKVAVRKGELGEYKIDIQLSQFPKEYKYKNDLLIENEKSRTGYSQIDHVVIAPYGIFIIETKNYQGTIYGGKDRKTWSVNGKFKMMSPLIQNYGHIKAIASLIDEKYHSYFISIVSFTKRSTFKIDEELRKIQSNELVVYDIELTEFIRRKVAVQKLTGVTELNLEEIMYLHDLLSLANITDPSIRQNHIHKLKNEHKEVKNEVSNCVVCDQPVSEKVKSFCLSNEKFKGKIYCFEHQKTI